MLYVCPTPIGNLDDITLRVVDVLRRAQVIACEDTRRTGKLLARFEIETPLVSFFEHNEMRRVPLIIGRLEEGDDVALVSDAGMPGLSDPGFTLVREAVQRDLEVTVLPGPSSVTTALVASGLPTDAFSFLGYVPRGSAKLVESLEAAGSTGMTLVAFESPRRLIGTLEAIAERWPNRRMAVCRELTKIHEEVLRGTPGDVLEAVRRPVRGEIVLVLDRLDPQAGGPLLPDIDAALEALLERGFGVKEASRLLSGVTGMSAGDLYDRALELRG